MKRPSCRVYGSLRLAAILLLSTASVAPAVAQFQRARGNPFKAPQATVHAPRERDYHVRHLKLVFDVDAANHGAKGVVTHTLTPLKSGLTALKFDAGANLTIDGCRIDGVDTPFTHEGELLTITAPTALSTGKEASVEIRYTMAGSTPRGGGANGVGGLRWIDPNPNDPTRKPGFWTQGETNTNHTWVPCYDFPNDKCTSETIVTVPESWSVIGNGIEGETKHDAEKHTNTFHWTMKQPHSTYLLSLVAGEMDIQKGMWKDVPLYYAVPKGLGHLIPSTFGNTPDMLQFFSDRLGVKYPWPKYAQSVVFEFGGGMENVSATTLGPVAQTLSDARSGNFPAASLTSHELAHQWFGDMITCNDWGDVWLNEGFATFFETAYMEHLEGKDAYDQERAGNLRSYLFESQRYKRPISTALYSNGDVMFDAHTYQRGSVILHMLRRQLGDRDFFGGLGYYLKTYAFQPVSTQDLIKALNTKTGKDVTPFFNQWVFKPGHPIVEVSTTYDEAGKAVVVHLKQTQDTSDGMPIYSLPLAVALLPPTDTAKSGAGRLVRRQFTFDKAEQEFRIPAATKPGAVLIDPDHDLLMDLKEKNYYADSELPSVLRFAPCYLDRSNAASRLVKLDSVKPEEKRQMFAEALKTETSPVSASFLLRSMADAKDESLRPVFRAGAKSKQPATRGAALAALGSLPKTDEDLKLLRSVAISDTEPYTVVEGALTGLSRMDADNNLEVFRHQIAAKSSRDRLAQAAVNALAQTKSDAAIPVMLEALNANHSFFMQAGVLRAIGTNAPGNAAVHTALLGLLREGVNPSLQQTAIRTLRERKDKEALPMLRDVAANSKSDDVRTAAKDAADSLEEK